jgi:hypothetical protein
MRLQRFAIALGCLLVLCWHARAENFGEYIGTLEASFLNDGRTLKLLKDYAFKDTKGYTWVAPEGFKVDGASIPRFFWTIIGGPLEGKYRNASVIHDVYCVSKQRSWEDTHRMFYDAMRANDVSELQAKLMFYAVYGFGPRWDEVVNHRQITTCVVEDAEKRVRRCHKRIMVVRQQRILPASPKTDEEKAIAVRQFQRELEAGKQISLAEIETLASNARGDTRNIQERLPK